MTPLCKELTRLFLEWRLLICERKGSVPKGFDHYVGSKLVEVLQHELELLEKNKKQLENDIITISRIESEGRE